MKVTTIGTIDMCAVTAPQNPNLRKTVVALPSGLLNQYLAEDIQVAWLSCSPDYRDGANG